MITVERLRERLAYEPDTGNLRWIATQRSGQSAGTKTKKGHLRLEVDGRPIYAHRAAWMMAYGSEPAGIIDHINGNPADNRLCNLRIADAAINGQNMKRAMSTNRLGVLGVVKVGRKYNANIWVDGAQKYLGTFEEIEMAHQCYIAAKQRLHPGYVS